mmetsp:Transcript_25310/g.72156  ORF Transcript_25310/g.72156 Transcript_25310/m.72156 type:complete len:205 (+) Transcript_25310:467-1081(+)
MPVWPRGVHHGSNGQTRATRLVESGGTSQCLRRCVDLNDLLTDHRKDKLGGLLSGHLFDQVAVPLVEVRRSLRVREVAEVATGAIRATARGEVQAWPRAQLRVTNAAEVDDLERLDLRHAGHIPGRREHGALSFGDVRHVRLVHVVAPVSGEVVDGTVGAILDRNLGAQEDIRDDLVRDGHGHADICSPCFGERLLDRLCQQLA